MISEDFAANQLGNLAQLPGYPRQAKAMAALAKALQAAARDETDAARIVQDVLENQARCPLPEQFYALARERGVSTGKRGGVEQGHPDCRVCMGYGTIPWLALYSYRDGRRAGRELIHINRARDLNGLCPSKVDFMPALEEAFRRKRDEWSERIKAGGGDPQHVINSGAQAWYKVPVPCLLCRPGRSRGPCRCAECVSAVKVERCKRQRSPSRGPCDVETAEGNLPRRGGAAMR